MGESDAQTERILAAIDALVTRRLALGPLRTEQDPRWPSPCEIGAPDDDGWIAWQPIRRQGAEVLAPLAATLGCRLHPALEAYYGRYWSNGWRVRGTLGSMSLIGVWNPEDQDRLLQNLLGHALQQQRLRRPLSLFFGCAGPDDEWVLSLRNDTGEVVLERPDGVEPVADDLGTFLDHLEPLADDSP
ncbi:MAG: SecY-interacting protein Syd [Pseudomonadales bacterium]|nr:SecY-interacting protein Syd [Pseudomonadales bacterium]